MKGPLGSEGSASVTLKLMGLAFHFQNGCHKDSSWSCLGLFVLLHLTFDTRRKKIKKVNSVNLIYVEFCVSGKYCFSNFIKVSFSSVAFVYIVMY